MGGGKEVGERPAKDRSEWGQEKGCLDDEVKPFRWSLSISPRQQRALGWVTSSTGSFSMLRFPPLQA